jgi:hypothetical protein
MRVQNQTKTLVKDLSLCPDTSIKNVIQEFHHWFGFFVLYILWLILSYNSPPSPPLFPMALLDRKKIRGSKTAGNFVAKFIVPYWGDKVDHGIGLSYRPAGSLCFLTGRYENPMPCIVNFVPQSGTMNLAFGSFPVNAIILQVYSVVVSGEDFKE